MLDPWIADGVVLAVEVDGARIDELLGRVVEGEAADIQRPQVEARLSVYDPLGHHLAGPTAAGDAVGEAGADEAIVELRRLAHDELAVRRERDRTVDQLTDAHLLDDRRALERC